MKKITAVLLIMSMLTLGGCGSLTRTVDVIGQIADILINGSDAGGEDNNGGDGVENTTETDTGNGIENTTETNTGDGIDNTTETNIENGDIEDTYPEFRSMISENGAICGVAYLGCYEGDYDEIMFAVDDTVSERVNGYISDITEENFVMQNGFELYSLITAEQNVVVRIYEQHYDENSDTYTALGDKLLEVTDGSPILILGNESEILSNFYIEIVTSDGETYGFSPCLSGMDGLLEVPEYVYDLSVYDDPMVYGGSLGAVGEIDRIYGIWYCETEHPDAPVSHIIQMTEDGTTEYSCGYSNSEIACMFSGSWTDNEDGTITLNLIGGEVIWDDDGLKYETSMNLDCVFEWEISSGNDLILTHISGDTLISTDEYARFSFSTLIE